MYVQKPITVTDANLTTNIPEPDAGETAYNAGTSYSIGDEVILTSTHRKYRSVQNSNTGHDPAADDGTWWVDIAPTNAWAMFDGIIGTQSTESTEIQISIDAGVYITGLAIFNVTAQTANVTVDDPTDGEVYNHDIDMRDNSQVVDWFTYFIEPIVEKRRVALWDLPAYPNATVAITLGSSGDVSVGECIFGQVMDLGVAQYGTGFQLLNFNVTERDAFGNIIRTTGRRTAKLGKYNIKTLSPRTEYVFNALDDLRDTACVWSGSTDDDKTLIYGYHSDARVNFSTPSLDDVSIEVEGLT